MKFKRAFKMSTGILTGCLLGGAVGGLGLSSASHAAGSPTISKTRVAGNDRLDTLPSKNPARGWICPMHAEVHAHAPGKCPICKMNLVKVTTGN